MPRSLLVLQSIPGDWAGPGVLLGVRPVSWHALGRPWNDPWHLWLLSTQTAPGQSCWPGSNIVWTHPQGWTKTGLASGEPGWTKRCTSVQPITFFTLGVSGLLFGDSISGLAIVPKDEFTNEHSLATKNSGSVYREGKGEAAPLQSPLLRRLIMPDGRHQFHCKTVPLWHFRRNMAGMTQDMALVEFATEHFLRNGWLFFKSLYFSMSNVLHLKVNIMWWVGFPIVTLWKVSKWSVKLTHCEWLTMGQLSHVRRRIWGVCWVSIRPAGHKSC